MQSKRLADCTVVSYGFFNDIPLRLAGDDQGVVILLRTLHRDLAVKGNFDEFSSPRDRSLEEQSGAMPMPAQHTASRRLASSKTFSNLN